MTEMGDSPGDAQYEADLARAMALSLQTHAAETQRRQSAGAGHVALGRIIKFFLNLELLF